MVLFITEKIFIENVEKFFWYFWPPFCDLETVCNGFDVYVNVSCNFHLK